MEAVKYDINRHISESLRIGVQAEVCDLGIDVDMLFSNWEASDFPPSKVRYTEFKQELIAIMSLGEERAIEFSMASNCDFNVEDEAQRLKKEMDITIQEVQESEFYKKLVEQIENDSIIQSNIRRVLEPNSCMQMVIYGLGSIEYNYRSQYQLAIAILLRRDFSCWIGGIEAFDPMMSPADCKVLEMFGCNVLTIDEQCKRQVEKPTLFYLPYLDSDLVGNLLEANWCPTRLNKIFVLGNGFGQKAEGCSQFSKKIVWNGKIYYNRLRERLEYVEAIKNHVIELQIDIPNAAYRQFVNGFSWHFFNLNLDLNLQSLLPGDPPMDVRLRSRRLDNGSFGFQLLKNMEEQLFMEPFYNTDPYIYSWFEMNSSYRNVRRFHCLWRPPHAGWIKLNFSGNAAVGFGGIFHDEHKNCLAMYSGNMRGEAVDSVVANAEALKQGLRCLQYLYSPARKLIVEGDDMQIIRWVNNGVEPSLRVGEALCEIWELLIGIEVVIRHVYEEANSMAIELAKRGTWLPNLRVWISPSLEDLPYYHRE